MLPNVLIIHTDQQSLWTISAYQKQNYLKTPNIDYLANNGALCTEYYANTNPCTPSRGCFLTGLYACSHGAQCNDMPINQSKTTFADVIKNRGYETIYIGKYHLDGPNRPGFVHPDRGMGFTNNLLMFNRGHFKKILPISKIKNDFTAHDQPIMCEEIGDSNSYSTDWLTKQAIKNINHLANGERPFLLMLSYPDPHPPYITREPYQSLYKPESIPLPETFTETQSELNSGKPLNNKETFLKKKAAYCSMIKLIDDNIGEIISELKKNNILSNTLIVFTTDHGDYMGEHGLMGKMRMHEAAYHIPMIIYYPSKIVPPKRQEFMWSTVDFAPTLLDLLDIKTKTEFEGTSYASQLMGNTDICKSNDLIYLEEADYFKGKSREIRLGIISKEFWYVQEHGESKYLYDRKKDPLQRRNLVSSSKYKRIISKLDQAIDSHLSKEKPNIIKEWIGRLSQSIGS